MKPEIKEQLVAALRSGKYVQGRHGLRVQNTYCCLGVLCDLYSYVRWERPDAYDDDKTWYYLDNMNIPPDIVKEWAGLTVEEVDVLVAMNDNRKNTFDEIAAYLESKP